MKRCSCTAIGFIAAAAAITAGLFADMICCKSQPAMNTLTGDLRRKAGRAMHALGDKIDKAADNFS